MEEHKEEVNAEDEAWAKMSYTDRFMWYLDNKILKSGSTVTPTSESKVHSEPSVAAEPVAPEPALAVAEVAAVAEQENASEIVAQETTQAVQDTPTPEPKKRSKPKKINIEV